MNARDLMDGIRADWIADGSVSPTRQIVYTRAVDDIALPPINAFVGGGNFNQLEKDTIDSYEVFSGLNLAFEPAVNDLVTYNGKTWKVTRYTRMGSLYAVYGKISLRAGAPRRR